MSHKHIISGVLLVKLFLVLQLYTLMYYNVIYQFFKEFLHFVSCLMLPEFSYLQ